MKNLVSMLVLAAAALAFSAAYADAIPPEVEPCVGSNVGGVCSYTNWKDGEQVIYKGTCQSATCSKDYSWRDGGIYTYSCVKCLDASGNTPQPLAADSSATGGCSMVRGSETGSKVAALLVAGSFMLLFLLRRRREKR